MLIAANSHATHLVHNCRYELPRFITTAYDHSEEQNDYCNYVVWLRGTVVERRSLTGELSLPCARPAADG